MTGDKVLAIDIGTSAVKAIVVDLGDGVVARGHAPVPTTHPRLGFDEQDPQSWWIAVQDALSLLPLDGIAAVGLSSQRETFVCLDEDAQPLRPAILWSDARAPSPAARWAWLHDHEPDVVRRTRWLAAPKDVVLHRLVGTLITDETLASRTDLDPTLLPEIVTPRTVVGMFRDAPVVAGAGDRACEVFAVNATSAQPMVSWGTTANCSLPLDDDAPTGWRESRTVDGGRLAEAGLSAAGAALGWLSERSGVAVGELSKRAALSQPGANGVVALPWLNGARAPWWRPDAQMTVLHETGDVADTARAIYEGVAHDIRRALAQLPQRPTALLLAGGGADDPCWQQCLSGVTGLPLEIHGADAAAIGAAQLTVPQRATSSPAARVAPDQPSVSKYAELAEVHDAAAASALGLSG